MLICKEMTEQFFVWDLDNSVVELSSLYTINKKQVTNNDGIMYYNSRLRHRLCSCMHGVPSLVGVTMTNASRLRVVLFAINICHCVPIYDGPFREECYARF